jgi:hypothetical protein
VILLQEVEVEEEIGEVVGGRGRIVDEVKVQIME